MFSTGDGHFAQGDGEVCVTAVEMGATAVVRFKLHKGLATRRKFPSPVFSRETYFTDPRFAAPERLLGVMGMPINAAGEIEAENLTLACRNAVLNMMELLQERGFSREQAYVLCSVAVDLRISNVVDVPNYVVSALLPEAIFDGDSVAHCPVIPRCRQPKSRRCRLRLGSEPSDGRSHYALQLRRAPCVGGSDMQAGSRGTDRSLI